MIRIRKSRITGMLLLAMLLAMVAACGGEEATPTPEPPAAVSTPLPTNTPLPTDTPAPTNTPVPTDTPTPTATPDISEGFLTFESTAGGYTIGYPSDWFTGEFLGFTTIASSEELLDAPEPGEEGGVALVLAGESNEFGGDDPVAAVASLIEDFGLGEDVEIVEGPTGVTINDQDAATAVISGTSDNGIPLAAYAALVIKAGRTVVFISATPAESETEFMPLFMAMADTIEVGQPEIVEGDGPSGELPEPEGFLLYGDTVSGTVEEATLSVWSFIGIEGEVIDLVVRPIDDELDVVVDILDENGTSILGGEVDDSFDTEAISNLTISSTGDFFIVLRGFAEAAGDYELTLSEAGASDTAYPTAGSISYGETVNSSVPDAAPSIWTFSGSADDIIDIIVEPLANELDVVVDVLDATGATILEFGEVDASFGLEEIRGLTLPSSGDFDIVVTGYTDSTGDYVLTVAESGEVEGSEGLILYGETVAGTVESADGSVWGFFGEEGDFVDITVTPLDEEFDLVVDVIDESGDSILIDGPLDVSYDDEFIRALRLADSGRYDVEVTGYEGATGRYELTLDQSNGGMPGSIIFAADTLEAEDETHAFPFTAAAGEVVTIQVEPESGFDVVIEVYNDDTDERLDEVDGYTGFEEYTFEVPEDGNYYFQVVGFEGGTGYYDVILLGSDTVLYELTIGDVIVGQLGAGRSIEYMFGGAAGDIVDLIVETDDEMDLVLQIVDANDNVLAEVDDNFSGESESLLYEFVDDELIFIRISDFFESEGEFLLSVESG